MRVGKAAKEKEKVFLKKSLGMKVKLMTRKSRLEIEREQKIPFSIK